jgi:hypothetical protein
MARRLKLSVVVGSQVYVGGDVPPTDVAKQITNPDAWEGEPDVEDDGGDSGSGEPPRSGRGSGEDVWREYATGLGIDVPDDAGRDDIVALVDARSGE